MTLEFEPAYRTLSWSDLPVLELPFGTKGHSGPLLDLEATLESGQSFRWRRSGDAWVGVIGGCVSRLWIDGPAGLVKAQAFPEPVEGEAFFTRYFRADVDLRKWLNRAADKHLLLAQAVERYAGLRVLRQDPVEVLLSFAGATARSISLITQSIELLAHQFGHPIAEIDGVRYHAFPSPLTLVEAPLEELARTCRLFYRAATLKEVARLLVERGEQWLPDLANGEYADAHHALASIKGIGPKVADCICLFGLGFDEAVPIDAHVWRLSPLIFPGMIPTRSLTPKTYQRLGALYRERFGRMAGWAQQYLFHARRDGALEACDRLT